MYRFDPMATSDEINLIEKKLYISLGHILKLGIELDKLKNRNKTQSTFVVLDEDRNQRLVLMSDNDYGILKVGYQESTHVKH